MKCDSGVDLIPGFICFFVGLFSELEYGIFAGVGVHLAMVLHRVARPQVGVERRSLARGKTEYIMVTPDQAVIFPSAAFVRTLISKAGQRKVH